MGKKKKKEIIKLKLAPKQELFCQLYASDREFFGNGVQSYIGAYEVDTNKKGAYKSAKHCAYRLLTNVDIIKRTNEILDISINDIVVDKELAFTILQKGNLHAKIAAIREYNALKGRVVQKQEIEQKILVININKDV